MMYLLTDIPSLLKDLARDLLCVLVIFSCFAVLARLYYLIRKWRWKAERLANSKRVFERMNSGFSLRVERAADLDRDEKALAEWERIHKFGPQNEEERRQYDELLFNAVASRMLMNDACDQSLFDAVTNQHLDDIKDDWRN